MQVPEKAQGFIDSLKNESAAFAELIADFTRRIVALQERQAITEERIRDAEKLVDFFKEAEPAETVEQFIDLAFEPPPRLDGEDADPAIVPPPRRALEASEDVDQAELTARERIRAAALEARGKTVDIARRAGVSRSHAAAELSKLAREGVIAHDGLEWGDPGAFS